MWRVVSQSVSSLVDYLNVIEGEMSFFAVQLAFPDAAFVSFGHEDDVSYLRGNTINQ